MAGGGRRTGKESKIGVDLYQSLASPGRVQGGKLPGDGGERRI